MGCGLVAGYGKLALMAGDYLYAEGGTPLGWQFVAPVEEFLPGTARDYVSPEGTKVVIARKETESGPNPVASFIALSSVCPHLGCAVHWEQQNSRFFCPCHNGAFDAEGKPLSGPPAKANQSLPQFALKVENGLLFIEVPLYRLTAQGSQPVHGSSVSAQSVAENLQAERSPDSRIDTAQRGADVA